MPLTPLDMSQESLRLSKNGQNPHQMPPTPRYVLLEFPRLGENDPLDPKMSPQCSPGWGGIMCPCSPPDWERMTKTPPNAP